MEKLNISFWIWGLFDTCGSGVYHDCETKMRELRERGFNCIRMEDGAGLYCKPDGSVRGPVTIAPPFGRYSCTVRQSEILPGPGTFDVRARLVEFFRAAERTGVKIILSSWYFLHTNWFLEPEVNDPIFALSTPEKMRYFTDELGRILEILEQNSLLHCLAFAELFNEFDGLPFAGEYTGNITEEAALELRALHEEGIARLKSRFPGVRFGYDSTNSFIREALLPRNVDVLNFHCYYLWNLYQAFEHGFVYSTDPQPPYPPEAEAFLLPPEKRTLSADVIADMPGGMRTGKGWEHRVSLYHSMDPEKLPALEAHLAQALEEEYPKGWDLLERIIASALDIRDRLLPGALLVMGEGVTYCADNRLLFEEHSNRYWEILRRQAAFLGESGLWGMIVRTTSGPEDPSWTLRQSDYIECNRIFRETGMVRSGDSF